MQQFFRGFGALLVGFLVVGAARADDWVLRADTSSRACRIELTTAAAIGVQLDGPFSSRADACKSALSHHDSSMSDTSKCWSYVQQTVEWCLKDGVTLPH
jgi:hypothetical protein